MLKKILGGCAIVLVLLFGGCVSDSSTQEQDDSLNVRNYNPVNIKHFESNKWVGSIHGEGTFEQFAHPVFGVRAGLIVLNSNIKHSDSVAGFVLRFGTEPDEGLNSEHIVNYINFIKHRLGYSSKIQQEDLYTLIRAVVHFEGGKDSLRFYESIIKQFEETCSTNIQCIRNFK